MKIDLSKPIKREGSDPIKSVTLQKPTVGAMRGLKLTDVLQMDVNAMLRLLPRITDPALSPDEVAGMDPADFMTLAGSVISFLVSPAQQAQLDQQSTLP